MLNTLSHSSHRCGPLFWEEPGGEDGLARGLAVPDGVVLFRGLVGGLARCWLSLLLMPSVDAPYGDIFKVVAAGGLASEPPGAAGGGGVTGTAA